MKHLVTTSAIVMALALPGMAFAQTAAPEATAPMAETTENTPMTEGFLASRDMTDMLASDLMGHDVYAPRTMSETPGALTTMTSVTATELESMDNVGQINDMIVSADGKVQAVVIGVGGFIGLGEQDVAVTMDQVSFATDATNPDEKYIFIKTSSDVLKSSPAFDRTAAMDGTTAAPAPMTAEPNTTAQREMLAAPAMERDGYARVAVTDISVDMLIGKTVYGTDEGNVGTVDDVIVDDAGAVKDVIVDFGGFLGMGTTKVALSFDEMTILTNQDNQDVRVYVDATKEQVQAMPIYNPAY